MLAYLVGDPGQVVRGFVNSVGSFDQAYHIPYPHWVDTRAVATAAGNPRWDNTLHDPDQIRRAAERPGPQLYLLHPDDLPNLTLLRLLHPEGQEVRHVARLTGRPFLVYFVPAPPGTLTNREATTPDSRTRRQ